MIVPFLRLAIKEKKERQRIIDKVENVLQHGQFIGGSEIEELEGSLRDITGRRFALGCSSGTGALYLAFRSLDIPQGSIVLMPALSWISTAQACIMAGHTPRFIECSDDYQICTGEIENAICDQTKALVLVNLCGVMGNISEIQKICKKHQLILIEDSSQSIGNKQAGETSGGIGSISCTSLGAMKALSGIGDAGIITTDDLEKYNFFKKMLYVGMENKYNSVYTSLNFRMDTVSAACLLVKLENWEIIKKRRKEIEVYYREALSRFDLEFPPYQEDITLYNFPVRIKNTNKFEEYLKANGIEVKRMSNYFMPDHESMNSYRGKKELNCRSIVNDTLLLPFHEKLSEEEIDFVCLKIKTFF
jgi:dTDP-4-amino-4,6-dideoxygalactose transaminase